MHSPRPPHEARSHNAANSHASPSRNAPSAHLIDRWDRLHSRLAAARAAWRRLARYQLERRAQRCARLRCLAHQRDAVGVAVALAVVARRERGGGGEQHCGDAISSAGVGDHRRCNLRSCDLGQLRSDSGTDAVEVRRGVVEEGNAARVSKGVGPHVQAVRRVWRELIASPHQLERGTAAAGRRAPHRPARLQHALRVARAIGASQHGGAGGVERGEQRDAARGGGPREVRGEVERERERIARLEVPRAGGDDLREERHARGHGTCRERE
eukprot:scaffold35557_cov61-Phaeocystis_antarctica.AAC.1